MTLIEAIKTINPDDADDSHLPLVAEMFTDEPADVPLVEVEDSDWLCLIGQD